MQIGFSLLFKSLCTIMLITMIQNNSAASIREPASHGVLLVNNGIESHYHSDPPPPPPPHPPPHTHRTSLALASRATLDDGDNSRSSPMSTLLMCSPRPRYCVFVCSQARRRSKGASKTSLESPACFTRLRFNEGRTC